MANAGPPPPGGMREELGEEALRREEEDDDGEAPLPPGATLPPDAFTSAEVKVKWKRRSLEESHSVRFWGRWVGGWVGRSVGRWVGRWVGGWVGGSVGGSVGRSVGRWVGRWVGGAGLIGLGLLLLLLWVFCMACRRLVVFGNVNRALLCEWGGRGAGMHKSIHRGARLTIVCFFFGGGEMAIGARPWPMNNTGRLHLQAPRAVRPHQGRGDDGQQGR